ncbi:MAG: hypothetical protein K8S15_14275 [Candidatus Aegiribacteria sp.]|nr:hypothetical protein [Candidatus Aegiribacteria sp.]
MLLLLLIAASLSAADVEYNTGGSVGYLSDLSGSSSGWGEWFITSYTNETSGPLQIAEFGFPCCGVPTGDFGWVVWVDMPDTGFPAGNPESCDFHGAFVPVEGPGGDPSVYTYIDIASVENIVFDPGEIIVFGYQNTGYGGQTPFNGTETWAWHNSIWEPDEKHYRTAVLEIGANNWSAMEQRTWSGIKSLF